MNVSKLLFFFLSGFLLCFCPVHSLAQNTDSLVVLINSDEEDSVKVNHLIGLAFLLVNEGEYPDALAYSKQAIELATYLKLKNKITKGYRISSYIHRSLGNYAMSMECELSALKIYEKSGDKKEIAASNDNIGVLYLLQHNYPLALKNFYNSLKVYEELKDTAYMAGSYDFIGNAFSDQQKIREALEYYFKSLHLYELQNDLSGILRVNNNIGTLYVRMGEYNKSLEIYRKNLSIDIENGEDFNIGLTYSNIAVAYSMLSEYAQAVKYADTALLIAKKINSKEQIQNGYKILADIAYTTKDYKNAGDYLHLYIQYRDSLINEESLKQFSDLKTGYAVEKKEVEMKAAQEKEAAVFKTIIWAVLAVLLLIAVFATFITRAWQTTRKQKLIIEKQKLVVDEKQQEIISSITYAKRLQDAIIPPAELMSKQLPDNFVLYLPKDIVAGDFYWLETVDDTVFIAVADCTGHGVPGAMVSVVCSNALNRAVKEFGLRDTGKILDKVTDLIIETFEKSNSEIKDGMDISLLAFNRKICQLQWSGANNPLWYVVIGEKEVKEIKPNKQPVGKYDNRQPFTTQIIPYMPDAVFYLFTDGLPDQFGGEKNKKFLYKRFKELLLAHSSKPLPEQENIFRTVFGQWKGNLEQTDDVTLIGLKV